MLDYMKIQQGMFWFLSIAVALVSYRFIVLGMEVVYANETHQLLTFKNAFYLHIITAPIALFVAPFQLSKRFRAKSVRRHRLMGRIYCAAVLVAGVTGVLIGFNAKGGPIAQSGFVLLAVIWLIATFRALQVVRLGQIGLHQEWMIRSIALTFAGVTLRIILPAQLVSGISLDVAYPIVAWLCWVPNLVVVEYFIRRSRTAKGRL
jgi:uncharacterized membrane protein|tara:strand:+ start:945 stop:1559 length:615 start_codon:yes stop_codon:yes gene_type:complete